MSHRHLHWIELDSEALGHNLGQFRKIIGDVRQLLVMVKANAYGHGMPQIAPLAVARGADWLGVHTLQEAAALQELGLRDSPILIFGYVPLDELQEAVERGLHMTVYNPETIDRLGVICRRLNRNAHVHLKLETGTNRQGVVPDRLEELAGFLRRFPEVEVEGVSSHFADIEDTTDHSFAKRQLEAFRDMTARLEALEIPVLYRHMSCTAAGILFPETHFELLRVGIGLYGLWPSKETYVSCLQQEREPVQLHPVLAWKARIVQIKDVRKGDYIGYGRTYRTTRNTRLAVLPVGYSDGYPRQLSNVAHVLIGGQRAPLRGRVAMNFITVDVTDIPEAKLEDSAVLLGFEGGDAVSADMLAAWSGTINYEIVARLNPTIPRLVINA
jgi:alanine racemase